MRPAHCAAAERDFLSALQAMRPAHCAATRNFPSTPQGRAATHRAQRSGVFPPRRRAMLPAHCAETRSFPSAPQGHAASAPHTAKRSFSSAPRAMLPAHCAQRSGVFPPRRRAVRPRTARSKTEFSLHAAGKSVSYTAQKHYREEKQSYLIQNGIVRNGKTGAPSALRGRGRRFFCSAKWRPLSPTGREAGQANGYSCFAVLESYSCSQ